MIVAHPVRQAHRDSPVSVVAIHQPNYVPWLGYFHKIARADHFVFLDNVQLPLGRSYTSRVRIAWGRATRWLSQPVYRRSGQLICDVRFADNDWPAKHLDTLRGAYGQAPSFRVAWDAIVSMYKSIPLDNLATANRFLINALARQLGLDCEFCFASEHLVGDARADDRLIALAATVAPGACYLSGRGGAKYQVPKKFALAGVPLRYTSFEHPIYPQGNFEFHRGLSVLDAIFHLGWEGARALIVDSQARSDDMKPTT